MSGEHRILSHLELKDFPEQAYQISYELEVRETEGIDTPLLGPTTLSKSAIF